MERIQIELATTELRPDVDESSGTNVVEVEFRTLVDGIEVVESCQSTILSSSSSASSSI